MESKQKIEMLKYNISRFDHYYASVNFKSSFLVIGNITLLGFLFTTLSDINICLFIAHVLVTILSLIFVLLAIKPYLKSYDKNTSLIFFNDIANMKGDEFKDKINTLTEESYVTDLKEQVYALSKGLEKKFSNLNKSTIFFICNIFLYCFTILLTMVIQ
ncbi:DUF5706 domain-containing protein [Aliarcobacter cryaerophilus]|uniref:Pycsar system effector family protein n=1 Tax=Aliarcobacter cryaerophilus TaxID=28198 RepID=UPI003DA6AEC6